MKTFPKSTRVTECSCGIEKFTVFRYLEELFDNIALNEIKLRDDLSQSAGDISLAERNWDDLLLVRSNFLCGIISVWSL